MSLRISMTSRNFARANQALLEYALQVEGSVDKTVEFLAQSTAQRAKHKIRSGSRTGKFSRRDNPDRFVQASAPGEPPADDLGNLARSISWRRNGFLSSAAFVTAPYAGTLEYGGLGGWDGQTWIEPRPFMFPSFDEARHEAVKRLRRRAR